MKLILKYVFLILIVSGCTNVVNYNENEEYFTRTNDIVYFKGLPFTGIAESKNQNGKQDWKETYWDVFNSI